MSAVSTQVTFRMSHLRPRWTLTIDPHLFIDGQYLGRLRRTTATVSLELGPQAVVVVAPTDRPPKWKLDPLLGPSVFGPYIHRTVELVPAGVLDIRYRPNLVSGYLFRGSLRIAAGGRREQSSHETT